MPTEGLEALKKALIDDDPRLMQGKTTDPPPLNCVAHWDCEGACALGFMGWHGKGLQRVGQVEEFFAESCFQADRAIGVAAACRWFLNWFDDTPREEMRRELAAEIDIELARRQNALTIAVENINKATEAA